MPCKSGPSLSDEDIQIIKQIDHLQLRLENKSYSSTYVDHLTRLLCEACGLIRGTNVSQELFDWWENHKKWDQYRREVLGEN